MKKIIKIKTKVKNYSILIENNSISSYLKKQSKDKNKIFIIIDTKVTHVLLNIKFGKNVKLIKINGSEKIKSISKYWQIISILLKYEIDRSSKIIAIGGGTIGDLSGFIASTILRGIDFTLIPTTLLSQVDSSIGGKNGINSENGKNLIGTFYQPDKVIIDPKILKTLPKRELRSGYAEILKHALISDKKFFKWLNINYKKVLKLENQYITNAITKSINIKSKFIQKDEKELLNTSSSRAMLNFGHTFGHALEALNKYNTKLTHGEAISIGMAAASRISFKMNNISKKDYDQIISHLKDIKLPYFDKRVKTKKIFKLILLDKKNTENKINLIFLNNIGSAYFERGLKESQIKKLL